MSMDIPLTKGAVAIVDDEDYELVSQYKWHLGSTGYAVWRGIKDGKKQTIRMHRLLTNASNGMVVDHINHNPLDNRRANLRVCTQSDNMRNKTEQGKGYWFHKQNNNWVVEVYGTHRGCFSNEHEAGQFVELVRNGVIDKKPKEERTHCRYGHSLEDAYVYSGKLKCKLCQKTRSREYYVRKTKHIMARHNG